MNPNPSTTGLGSELISIGRELREADYVNRLMSADRLTDKAYQALKTRIEKNDPLDEAESWNLKRTSLERFYRKDVSADLVALDDRGRFRECIFRLESLLEANQYRQYTQLILQDLNADPQNRVIYRNPIRTRFLDQALRKAGIWDGISFDWDRVVEKGMLGEFINYMKSSKAEFENLFDQTLRKDMFEKPISQLNALLETIGLKLTNVSKRVVNHSKVYSYGWDKKRRDLVEEIRNRRASVPVSSEPVETPQNAAPPLPDFF